MEEVGAIVIMAISAVLLILLFVSSIISYGKSCKRLARAEADIEIWHLKRDLLEALEEVNRLKKMNEELVKQDLAKTTKVEVK